MLDFSQVDHHNLTKLADRVNNMRVKSAIGPDRTPKKMSPIMQKAFAILAEACVMHTELAFPEEDFKESKDALLMLGLLPAPTRAGASGSAWQPGMQPGPPPTASLPPDDDMEVTSGKKKKAKKKAFDWEEDGEWRAEPKLPNDPTRERGIKVMINEHPGWSWIEGDAKQTLLEFYDNAEIKETCKSVQVAEDRVYDYRFEGGHWMSQSNPKYPERRWREVVVVYRGKEAR
jgi:hypothetical protein